MNRRRFLSMLNGSAAGAVAPTYFFAPIGGWKSDIIVNPNSGSLLAPSQEIYEYPFWYVNKTTGARKYCNPFTDKTPTDLSGYSLLGIQKMDGVAI